MKYQKKIIKILIFSIFFIYLLISLAPSSISAYSSYKHYEIYDKDNNLILHIQNDHIISNATYEEIPNKLIQVLLFLEDKHFFKHSGFDIYRISKTIITNILNNETHGASTITQQYIKNVYLSNKKSIFRKIKEAIFSVALERKENKEDILLNYLNTIYLGNNHYGVKNATKYYFNKELNELNINEIVLLTTILKAPSLYNPITNMSATLNKKDELLKVLNNNKIITNYEFDSSYKITPNFFYTPLLSSNLAYYIDIVKQEIKNINHTFNMEETIKIYTNYNQKFNTYKIRNINGDYSVLIANKNGYLEYVVGGKSYYDSEYNIAYKGNRDIGSTIKPLLYYEALKCGIKITKTYKSEPLTIIFEDKTYTFKNYNNLYPKNNIDMSYALATSDNIYAVKTHLNIGMKTLVNHLKLYDVEAKNIPSLALGSVSMSLKKLAEIYSCIQNDGIYSSFRTISKIESCNKSMSNLVSKKQILDINHVKIIKELMKGMFDQRIASNVTGASISKSLLTSVSGKSGLTNYDSYMLGFNENYLVACWSGHIDNELLIDDSLKKLPKELFLNYINLCI